MSARQDNDDKSSRGALAQSIAEAARDFRLAEPLSERDPELLLQAQRELDLLLADWEELTRSAQPTPKEEIAAVVKKLGPEHGLLKELLHTDKEQGTS